MENKEIITKGNHSYVDWLRGRNYFGQPKYNYYDQADMLSQTLFNKSYKQLYTYEQNYIVQTMVKAGVR